MLDIFSIPKDKDKVATSLTSFITSLQNKKIPLRELHQSVTHIQDVLKHFGENARSIIHELADAQELVAFLIEIANEDILFL